MTVNRSRFRAFDRAWMWIAVFFLGIFWLGQLFIGYESYQDVSFEEDVRLRYLDREMLLLDAGDEGNRFHDWWTGRSDLDDTLAELESLIPEDDYQWEAWDGAYGMTALDHLLASHRGESLSALEWSEYWPRETLKKDLLSDDYPAFMAKLYLSEGDDPEIRALYEGQAATLLQRSYLVSVVNWLFLIGAVFVCGHALSRSKNKLPRFPSLWSPALLLTVFFGMGIFASLFLGGASIILYFLPDDVYWPWIAVDFSWRALPTFLMGALLFLSPRAMWKTFGLDRPIAWRCLLFALGVNIAFNLAQYYSGSSGEVDPEDYFFYPDPEGVDLFEDFLSGVIAAPIFEEVIFRGFLFLGLQKRIGVGWAALISSVLFGIVHIQYDFWGILGVTAFGLICTWLTWRTQSIKTGIIFHAIGNLLISIDVFLYYQMALR